MGVFVKVIGPLGSGADGKGRSVRITSTEEALRQEYPPGTQAVVLVVEPGFYGEEDVPIEDGQLRLDQTWLGRAHLAQ